LSLGKKMQYAKGDLKIIPKYEEWLYKHSRDLKTHHMILDTIFDRPERVREGSFSASGAGQCLRRRQLSYLGYPQTKPNEKTMNIFVNGDFVHLRHQIAGIQMGYFMTAEEPLVNEEYNLTGTADAIMDDGGIGEIKSINDNGFSGVASYGPKKEHNEQIHSYMLAADVDHARILYENKNTNELKEFLVKRNPQTVQKIVDDLTLLNEYTSDEVLAPPLATAITMTGECRWCPFQKVCLDARFASQQATTKSKTVRIKLNKPTA